MLSVQLNLLGRKQNKEKYHCWLSTKRVLKVNPDDATLLRGALLPEPLSATSWKELAVCSQQPRSRNPTLLETLATLWNSMEQCPMGTLSLVSWSKVALSRRTLRCRIVKNWFKGKPWILCNEWAQMEDWFST